jgi:hypothetical protein
MIHHGMISQTGNKSIQQFAARERKKRAPREHSVIGTNDGECH